MPKLQDYRDYHFEATVKVSEIARTLALAEIGIIWIFTNERNGSFEISNTLLLPIILIVCTLLFDFLQQVYKSIAFHIIYRKFEIKEGTNKKVEDKELYIDTKINTFSYMLFYIKILCLLSSYILLGRYLLGKFVFC